MRIRVVGDIGANMAAILDEEVTSMSSALRSAVDRAATDLQSELRQQVRAAGLGTGLANAWRKEVYPRGRRRTLRPAGLVYSKATALHDAFEEGAVVLPRSGSFLLIPSDAAERMGVTYTTRARKGGTVPGGARRRLSSLEAAASKLGVPIVSARPAQSVPRRGSGGGRGERGFILLTPTRRNRSTLAALYFRDRDARPVLLFTLVRSAKVPKRLDVAGAAQRAEGQFAAALSSALGSGG